MSQPTTDVRVWSFDDAGIAHGLVCCWLRPPPLLSLFRPRPAARRLRYERSWANDVQFDGRLRFSLWTQACSARCRSIRSRIRSSKSLSRQVLIHHYRQSVTALARAQSAMNSSSDPASGMGGRPGMLRFHDDAVHFCFTSGPLLLPFHTAPLRQVAGAQPLFLGICRLMEAAGIEAIRSGVERIS
jgi:hypothetical protein